VSSRFDAARLQRAFDLVARQVETGIAPSAVLAVAEGSTPPRIEAFSGTDPATTDSIYMIASIAKPITATAVMQLVERGLLVLSTPLQHYLPEFVAPSVEPGLPGAGSVTAWHLLTHTNGIMEMDAELLTRERPSRQRLLEIACTSPLRFVPGSRWEYGSLSFALLGELIHRLDGRDHPEYLRDEIFGPLGMRDTAYQPVDPARGMALHLPAIPDAFQAAATAFFNSMQAPGGGLWATAADLVAFGQAMLGGGRSGDVRILGRRFVAQMTRDQTAGIMAAGPPPSAAPYGLGWALPGASGRQPASPRAFGHGGATGTRLLVDPDADLVVVYLVNRWGLGDEASWAAVQAVYAALDD
jgi:CubicO group peptidase (beta-lactamase class C family)